MVKKIKVGDQFRLKRNWLDKLFGKPELIYTVVQDQGKLWFRDFHTIYPGGTGIWCGFLEEFDLSEWEKV